MYDDEIENTQEEENFSDLLENSMPGKDDFIIGEKVAGTVVHISRDSVFVDISGKSEAVIEIQEFIDDSGELTVKNGDRIEAFVVSNKGGEIQLTKHIGRGQTGSGHLSLAYENMIPVTGVVTSEIKGGFSVSISGNRSFCPFSHFDLKPLGDTAQYLNKSFNFLIIQYSERGRNIILSRKALLEEQQQKREAELREHLKEGDTVEGRVANVKNFGLFVDLDGFEALVPKSEISWSRNPDIKKYPPGTGIKARVLSADWDSGKISLSIKAALPDPWGNRFPYEKGMNVPAVITGIIKNGAFAEIEPGIEGFLHVSRMSYTKRINRPEDAVSINQSVTVKINEIYPEKRKLDLELVTAEADPWQSPEKVPADSSFKATIESAVDAGLRVRLENGMLGFLPKSELISGSGDISRTYQTGSEITVSVKEINASKKNLILSEKNAATLEEKNDLKEYASSQKTSDASLGSLFQSQFEDIKKKIGDGS